MHLAHEELAPHFHKWHICGFPFHASIHHLMAPDEGDPHDHPWSFSSFVLRGWYTEEQFDRATGAVTRYTRTEGASHRIDAEQVHRIVEVSPGGCWTIIVPAGPYARKPRFWRFGPRIVSRAWDEAYPA